MKLGAMTPADSRRMVGLCLSLFVLLVAESSRGLLVSSMFTFIRTLIPGHPDTARRANSLAVSVFSIGRLVAAPLFGAMCDRYSFRLTFFTCLLLSAVGHMLYSFADLAGGGYSSLFLLVFSRGIVGLGSGVLGVSRAAIALLTGPDDRLKWFSALSVAKFMGYALAPTIAVFITISEKLGVLSINQYTAPAEILALLNLITMPVIWFVLDPHLGKTPPPPPPPPQRVSASFVASPLSLHQSSQSLTCPMLEGHRGSYAHSILEGLREGHRGSRASPHAHADEGAAVAAPAARRPAVISRRMLVAAVNSSPASGGGGGMELVWSPLPQQQPSPPAATAAAANAASDGGGRSGSLAEASFAPFYESPEEDAAAEQRRALLLPTSSPSQQQQRSSSTPSSITMLPPLPALPPSLALRSSFLSDPVILAGIVLFITLNGVSKGVLTLMEAVATPMFQAAYSGATSDADLVNATALWYAKLGAGGLLVYVFVALPRKKYSWLPSDLTLLVGSALATACGAFILAHPWAWGGDELSMSLLDVGAALVWSVGAPIADVVAVSCFSLVVAGKAQGAWMGSITMAGSIGRITFPLLTLFISQEASMLIAAVLSILGVPAVVWYRLFKGRADAAKAAAAAAAEEAVHSGSMDLASLPPCKDCSSRSRSGGEEDAAQELERGEGETMVRVHAAGAKHGIGGGGGTGGDESPPRFGGAATTSTAATAAATGTGSTTTTAGGGGGSGGFMGARLWFGGSAQRHPRNDGTSNFSSGINSSSSGRGRAGTLGGYLRIDDGDDAGLATGPPLLNVDHEHCDDGGAVTSSSDPDQYAVPVVNLSTPRLVPVVTIVSTPRSTPRGGRAPAPPTLDALAL